MNNIQDFINEYFTDTDIFYIGTKDRKTGDWKQYALTKNEVNYKLLEQFNYYKKDIYISLNTFKEKKGRWESNVAKTDKIFFDIDINGDEIKNKIIEELGEPTYLLQTSKNKWQLIYQLDKSYNKEDIKRVSKLLSHHFNTDKTFDLARVFRAPFFINNKNGFKVQIMKLSMFQKKPTLEHFENYIIKNNIQETEQEKQKTQSTTKSTNKILSNVNFNPSNKFIDRYLEMVESCNNDKSAADLKFVRYLMYRRYSFKSAIKNLLECREDIFTKHKNIDTYINRLEEATADITTKQKTKMRSF